MPDPTDTADAHARRQHLAYTIHKSEAELDAWIMREAGRIGGTEVARLRAAATTLMAHYSNFAFAYGDDPKSGLRACVENLRAALEPTHAD